MQDVQYKGYVKDSRVLNYLNLNQGNPVYCNTEEEEVLLYLWHAKYTIAKEEYNRSRANPEKLFTWRNSFEGTFFQLDKLGKMTDKPMKPLRKISFEIVSDKKQSHIPAPKMTPRQHSDIVPVQATEQLIRWEVDRMLSEEFNEDAENHVLIDGTVWLKCGWNDLDGTHGRDGAPIWEVVPIDRGFPQPGVTNYKKMEYFFEEQDMTVSQVFDIYGRYVHSPNNNDTMEVVNCYYLNEDRLVGVFTFVPWCMKVLRNDKEWLIRKKRICKKCGMPEPEEEVCDNCGSKVFERVSVKKWTLEQKLDLIQNPYRDGETESKSEDGNQVADSLPEGTEIPPYLIRQIPFVPYRRIKTSRGIYGISEVELALEPQDMANKMWNKIERKVSKSKAVVTKLKETNIDDDDDEIMYVEIEDAAEGAAIQTKQIVSDIQYDLVAADGLYNHIKSTSGVTDTDQGKNDPSARSGKAKQLQLQASAGRSSNPMALRNSCYSGMYELTFKFLLSFSDANRSFVKTLPDGSQKEEVWSKYMFLDQDEEDGKFFWRDDFAWSVDTATEITQDRASMWQLIDNDYVNGVMGNEIDPVRALRMYWHMKEMAGYPTAKFALAFLNEAAESLPDQIEQVLAKNPEAVQLALSYIADMQKGQGQAQGGARDGAGRPGNNATHAANVEKTNNKNRSAQGQQTTTAAVSQGGAQGGISNDAK
jgi:hypothetical protein